MGGKSSPPGGGHPVPQGLAGWDGWQWRFFPKKENQRNHVEAFRFLLVKGEKKMGIRRKCMTTESLMLLMVFTLIIGCASKQVAVKVPEAAKRKTIEMTAENFAFAPNLIQAEKGDTLLLTVRNTAGSEHNITIKDPEGKVLISRDIPSEGTVELEINLLEHGNYEFFCDKPFHTTFGMKGSIEAKATGW
jgi:plastocyanin